MQRHTSSFIFSVLMVLPSAFLSHVNAEAQPKSETIFLAAALSGPAASFGDMEQKGATLAVEELNADGGVNGAPLRLEVEDTRTTNSSAISAVRKLVASGASIIVGPTWLDSYQGVLPVAEQAGLVLITPSASVSVFKKDQRSYPMVFSVWYNIDREVDTLLTYALSEHLKRMSLVVDEDPYFQTLRQKLRERSTALGIEIVSDVSVPFLDSDLRAVMPRLRLAAADVTVFGFGNDKNLLSFLKLAKEASLKTRFIGTDYIDGFAQDPQYRALLDGIEYAAISNESHEFEARFLKRFGQSPLLSAAPAYDIVKLIAAAMREGQRSPQELARFLRGRTFELASMGKTRFDSLGQVEMSRYRIRKVSSGTVSDLQFALPQLSKSEGIP